MVGPVPELVVTDIAPLEDEDSSDGECCCCCGCCTSFLRLFGVECGDKNALSDEEEEVPLLSQRRKPGEVREGSPAPRTPPSGSTFRLNLIEDEGEEGSTCSPSPVMTIPFPHTPRTPAASTSVTLLSPLRQTSLQSCSQTEADVEEVLKRVRHSRSQLDSLDSVCQFFQTYAPYFPVQIHIQLLASTTPSSSLLTEESNDGSSPSTLSSKPPVALVVEGPPRANSSTELLHVMEDVLLEECDALLCIRELHCADISFSHQRSASVSPSPWSTVMKHLNSASPQTHTTADGAAASLTLAHSVFIFMQNVLDNSPSLRRLVLTRVACTPQDMIAISAPQGLLSRNAALQVLSFEQCPLSPPHIMALVSGAREEGVSPLSLLQELQLSGGALTVESIAQLLEFLEEQHLFMLRQLRLPALLVNKVQRHPGLSSHPELVVSPLKAT